MEKLSRVKKYAELRKSIELENSVNNLESDQLNQEREEAFKKFDSSILKKTVISEDSTPIHENVEDVQSSKKNRKADDSFTNEYLDDFIREVREYNIRKGLRKSEDTQIDILSQLSVDNRNKREEHIQPITESNCDADVDQEANVLNNDIQNIIENDDFNLDTEDETSTKDEISTSAEQETATTLIEDSNEQSIEDFADLCPENDKKADINEIEVPQEIVFEEENIETDYECQQDEEIIADELEFDKTQQILVQSEEAEEDVIDKLDNSKNHKKNSILNIILTILIILLIIVIAFICYYIWKGGLL